MNTCFINFSTPTNFSKIVRFEYYKFSQPLDQFILGFSKCKSSLTMNHHITNLKCQKDIDYFQIETSNPNPHPSQKNCQ